MLDYLWADLYFYLLIAWDNEFIMFSQRFISPSADIQRSARAFFTALGTAVMPNTLFKCRNWSFRYCYWI